MFSCVFVTFQCGVLDQESGHSDWLGNCLKVFVIYDPWIMNLIFCLIVAMATNVPSNTAMATLLMPILAYVAVTVGIHLLYLMISITVACSFAFMLPVATPPNAIVFSTGYLSIPDMMGSNLTLTTFLERMQIPLKAGHHRPASDTPYKWRFAGIPIMAQN